MLSMAWRISAFVEYVFMSKSRVELLANVMTPTCVWFLAYSTAH